METLKYFNMMLLGNKIMVYVDHNYLTHKYIKHYCGRVKHHRFIIE